MAGVDMALWFIPIPCPRTGTLPNARSSKNTTNAGSKTLHAADGAADAGGSGSPHALDEGHSFPRSR
ncbi:hypothetical protein MPL3365_70330 [Mesorhizobium plurifarium]|uniref:Uncharacterized protein n=1 Tax=Mesorhizobium plurifarium TaxID=69974 RepID=A0A090GW32_MESPL|nr:hypothetical protein MPL3365_70330 [Mesorhizobium plurifarium]